MNKFDANDATFFAEDIIFDFDKQKSTDDKDPYYFSNQVPAYEYICNFNYVSNFLEYVVKYSIELGYSVEECNSDEISISKLATFLEKTSKNNGTPLSRQTLTNWLSKGIPANTPQGRDNVYKLCFTLKLNEEQTEEFFLKAYFERPYDFKNPIEVAYYYCQKNGLSYANAIEMLKEAEEKENESTTISDYTQDLRNNINNINGREELINYLAILGSSSNIRNYTAIETIKVLLDSCYEHATKEHFEIYGKKKEVKTIDALLKVVYAFSARISNNKEDSLMQEISNSKFPYLIKRNFPQRQQFQNILSEKASYDVVRKALVMLHFYDFFSQNSSDIEEIEDKDELYNEYLDEIDNLLYKCGFVQLYPRNPYDWVFMYCAYSINPINEFRDIISEFRLGEDE